MSRPRLSARPTRRLRVESLAGLDVAVVLGALRIRVRVLRSAIACPHPFPWDMLVRTKIYVWSPPDWTLLQRDRGWLSLARSLSPPSMNAYCARLPTKSSAQGAHMTGCQVGCRADLYCTSTGTSSLRGPGRKSRMEWLGSVSASWEMSCGFLCAVGLRCMTLSAWGALHDD